MLAFFGTSLGKFILGLLMPSVIAAVKAGVSAAWEKIPAWIQPLVSSALGAAAGAAATVAAGGADVATISAGAAVGAAGGASGKAVRDSARAAFPWMDDNKSDF